MLARLAPLALALVACAPSVQPRDAAPDAIEAADASEPDAIECGNGTQRACYSGPAATSGVGVCRPGVQRCFGGAWGPCVGETTPGAEVCGNGADDDCDGRVDCGVDAGADAQEASAPDAAPPCVDADGDGYGMGAGCRGPDCNDADRDSYPGADERCDGRDNNCDGRTDDASEWPALDAYCQRTLSPGAAMQPGITAALCRTRGRMLPSVYDPTALEFTCEACWRATPRQVCACWTDQFSSRLCPP